MVGKRATQKAGQLINGKLQYTRGKVKWFKSRRLAFVNRCMVLVHIENVGPSDR